MFSRSLLALAAVLTLTFACEESERSSGAASGSASNGTNGAPMQAESTVTGRVAETMDAGGYTYVLMEHEGTSIWAAGPESPVSVGDELALSLGMKMQDFHSRELDRTFDTIYFVDSFRSGEASGSGDTSGAARSASPKTDVDLSGITVPDGGMTVQAVWEQRSELAKKNVTVRGRVVKFNANIMGKNWLHLQDGSGDADAGTHDVTVTTLDAAEVGDLVTVRGMVAVDEDFGAGYRYGLILQEARITVE